MQTATFSFRQLYCLVAALSLLLATSPAHAQAPANDDPCGAVALTPQGSLCLTPTVGTNVGATTTVPNGYTNPATCGGGTAPRDVWFTFTTAATGPASFGAAITVTGNPAGLVRVLSAASCTGPFTEIACSGAGQANTVAPRLTTGALQASTTYYVQVAGYAPSDPAGQFTICVTDGPGQPTCGTPVLGTPTYASPTTATIPLTLGVNNTFPVAVQVTGPGGFSQNTTVSASPIQLSGLTQGTAYTVRVTATCAGSGQTSVPAIATITTTTRYCSTGLGGFCGTAAITEVSIAGTTLNNRQSVPYCTGGYVAWPATGNTTATLLPGTPYQLSATVMNPLALDNVTAWLDFNQDGQFQASEVIMPTRQSGGSSPATVSFLVPLTALPGLTGLRVRSAASSVSSLPPGSACANVLGAGETEDYTVTIGAPVGCPTPTGLAITNLTSSSATLSFVPVPGAVSYTLTYEQPGYSTTNLFPQTTTRLVTTSPVQLSNLIIGNLGISLTANCGPGSVSAPARTFVVVPNGAPLNDECASATLLSTGTNPVVVSGGTNFATITTPVPAVPAACALTVNADVWYRFVATGPNHDVVVEMSQNGQLLLETFAGTCGGFLRLGCQAYTGPGGNVSDVITLPLIGLTPGQTYYVRVAQTTQPQLYIEGFSIVIRTPGPGYCVSNLGGSPMCAGPNITTTTIAGTTLNHTGIMCNTAGTVAYEQFRDFGSTTATLTAGQTYQLANTITAGPADVSMWIDYNQNYLFEPSEYVAAGQNASGSSIVSFTVPAGALGGPTRMRLRSRAPGLGNGPTDACTDFLTSGETHDYTVTILNPTPVVPCAGPTAISVTNLTYTTASVNFSPPAGATGVVIQYQAAGQATQTLTLPTTTSPVALTGLLPGISYTLCVSSICSTGVPSAPVCGASFTLPALPPCNAPTALTASNVSSTGATLSFTAPTTAVSSYTVTYQAAGGPVQTVTPAPTASPFALTSLLPNTAYTVRVLANCTAGGTSAVVSTSFTTAVSPSSCLPPTGVTVTVVNSTTISVSFTLAVGGSAASRYIATATPVGGGTAVSDTSPLGPILVSGLRPGVSYTVTVVAVCGGGTQSAPSAPSAPFSTVLSNRAVALASQVSLLPNPAHVAALLTLPPALRGAAGPVRLRNALGQVVREVPLPAATGTTELPLSGLSAGLYLVEVPVLLPIGPAVVTKRLMVE